MSSSRSLRDTACAASTEYIPCVCTHPMQGRGPRQGWPARGGAGCFRPDNLPSLHPYLRLRPPRPPWWMPLQEVRTARECLQSPQACAAHAQALTAPHRTAPRRAARAPAACNALYHDVRMSRRVVCSMSLCVQHSEAQQHHSRRSIRQEHNPPLVACSCTHRKPYVVVHIPSARRA